METKKQWVIEGFGLTPLSVDRRGYMPPLLKTKQDIFNTLIYEHICGGVEQEDNVVLKTNHLLW